LWGSKRFEKAPNGVGAWKLSASFFRAPASFGSKQDARAAPKGVVTKTFNCVCRLLARGSRKPKEPAFAVRMPLLAGRRRGAPAGTFLLARSQKITLAS
jgi:hypothetical protein